MKKVLLALVVCVFTWACGFAQDASGLKEAVYEGTLRRVANKTADGTEMVKYSVEVAKKDWRYLGSADTLKAFNPENFVNKPVKVKVMEIEREINNKKLKIVKQIISLEDGSSTSPTPAATPAPVTP